jgi:arginase
MHHIFQARKTNMKRVRCALAVLILVSVSLPAQEYLDEDGKIRVVILTDPYTDSRTGPEKLQGPDHLANGGLEELLLRSGCTIEQVLEIRMPADREREYGEWNRASLTNRELGRSIYAHDRGDCFFLGLLSGSKSLVGVLAGLQHLGPERAPLTDSRGRDILGLPRLGKGRPLKVGLVWIDARAAFNTPDITIEGDMGGMNVAVAAGRSNTTLRLQAGLDPPLSTKHIVMVGVRDTSPYEEVHIDESFIERISVNEIRTLDENIEVQMRRLSRLTDIIYVHVDLSVLDPEEIPGHPRPVAGGPSSRELSACLEIMFKYPKAAALGVASMPEAPEKISLRAAHTLVEGAIQGIKNR